MSSKVIGIIQDDETIWHAMGVMNDYDSLCGVDGNDPGVGHHGVVDAPRGQKINCVQCKAIWTNTMSLKLRASNFA